jgi:hypothetical protein
MGPNSISSIKILQDFVVKEENQLCVSFFHNLQNPNIRNGKKNDTFLGPNMQALQQNSIEFLCKNTSKIIGGVK